MAEGFRPHKLAELAHFTNGYAFKPSDFADNGLPVVRIQQLLDVDADTDRFNGQIDSRFMIRSGDIVMSWSGTIAVVKWERGNAWLNQHLFRVDPRDGVSREFFRHLLYFAVDDLLAAAHGTTMKHITRAELSRFVVLLPPLEEQRRIAEVLDTIDETIQATERVIAKLRAIREGLFTEGVEAAISTGRIRRLGEVVDQSSDSLIQTGPFGSQLHASEYIDEGIPAFMPRDIREGKLDIRRSAKISVDKANELGRHRLRSGDVLLARRGDLSQCAVVAASQAESICGTGCLLVRIPREELEPEWLVAAYRHEFIQRQVQARAIGSTMLNLSATLVRSLLIPFPSQASQRLMLGIQESSRRLEAERANLAKLQQLRAGLAADLLSGRVQTVAV